MSAESIAVQFYILFFNFTLDAIKIETLVVPYNLSKPSFRFASIFNREQIDRPNKLNLKQGIETKRLFKLASALVPVPGPFVSVPTICLIIRCIIHYTRSRAHLAIRINRCWSRLSHELTFLVEQLDRLVRPSFLLAFSLPRFLFLSVCLSVPVRYLDLRKTKAWRSSIKPSIVKRIDSQTDGKKNDVVRLGIRRKER